MQRGLLLAMVACTQDFDAFSPRAAADPWHTVGGWLTFVVSVAVLLQIQRGLPATKADTAWDMNTVRA